MRGLQNASKFTVRRKGNHRWRFVSAALVVFCIAFAMGVPAIATELEDSSFSLEAHSHTEACYQLVCGKEEIFSHTHGDECYEEDEEGIRLICTLTERTLHHHGPDCNSRPEPICGLTEARSHTHTEECYSVQFVLTCGEMECASHAHSDDCYTDGVLSCTLEETPGHIHTEQCYEEQTVLTCSLEETEGHTHTEDCYPADFEPELICGEEDIPEHRHTEDCYRYVCEEEEYADASEDHSEDILQDMDTQDSDEMDEAPEQIGSPETSNSEINSDDGLQMVLPTQAPPVDLAPYITDFVFTNSNEDSVAFEENQYINVGFRLGFQFDVQVLDGVNTLSNGFNYYFDFSADSHSLFEGVDKELDTAYEITEAEEIVGTYRFVREEETGFFRVYISVLPDYLPNAETAIRGEVDFSADVDGQFGNENGDIVLPYKSEQSLVIPYEMINYPANATNDYDLLSSTSGGVPDADSRQICCTVSVDSEKGTPGDVQFNDTFTTKNETVLPFTLPSSVEITDKDGNDITLQSNPVISKESDQKSTISMTLPQMNAGDRYTVTYAYEVGELTEGETVEFTNEVIVSSTNDRVAISHRSSADGSIDRSAPEEAGEPFLSGNLTGSYDLATGKIKWKLEIIWNGSDGSNQTLTDELFSQAENLTVRKANGEDVTGDDSYYRLEGNTITFPPRESEESDDSFVIEFATEVGNAGDWGGEGRITNTVIVDYDAENPIVGIVTLQSGKVEMTMETPVFSSGKVTVDWAIHITPATNGMPSVIEDWLIDVSDNHIVYDSVQLCYVDRMGNRIQRADVPAYSVLYKDTRDGTENTDNPRYFQIIFNDGVDPFDGTSFLGNGAQGLRVVYQTESAASDEETSYCTHAQVKGLSAEKTVTFSPAVENALNQSVATLPTTGGIGTTMFYVLGSILVIGAVVLLVSKKRMNAID